MQGCKYWKHLEVATFCKSNDLKTTVFHGCAYGLSDCNTKKPIYKPWRIDTNVPEFLGLLSSKCPGNHEHIVCRGARAKGSENYTDEIVSNVHLGWAERVKSISLCVSSKNAETKGVTHKAMMCRGSRPSTRIALATRITSYPLQHQTGSQSCSA